MLVKDDNQFRAVIVYMHQRATFRKFLIRELQVWIFEEKVSLN